MPSFSVALVFFSYKIVSDQEKGMASADGYIKYLGFPIFKRKSILHIQTYNDMQFIYEVVLIKLHFPCSTNGYIFE